MIKILLADDHQMFIDGMKSVLEDDPNIEVVGEAKNGKEVLDIIKDTEVDVAILDIRMPKINGIEATKVIRKEYPKTKVLILTMYNEKDLIIQLMKIGASGYVLKEKSSEELLMAINNVYGGKSHYGLEVINTATSGDQSQEEKVDLTPREIDVLRLIALGHTTKEISIKLYIAEATVSTHRRNLLQKLDVPHSHHLVRYAIKHGIISL